MTTNNRPVNCLLPPLPAEQNRRRLVTYADWETAGSFEKCAKPGDLVEEEIVDNLVNCLPPASLSAHYFQLGEPHSHEYDPRKDRFCPTFLTFFPDSEGWRYCGNCFLGDRTQPAAREEK